MKRSCWTLHILMVSSLVFGTAGLGQETGDQTLPSQGPASKPTHLKRLPILGSADEFSLAADLEYYEPYPGFNRMNRDIDLEVARAAVSAHFRRGWEFQFDAIALRATGTSTVTSSTPAPVQAPSNALAAGAGPLARWNFLQFSRCRFFVDGQGDLIFSDRPFPNRGTIYNFFLRASGGVNIRLSNSYWAEAALHVAHISNAQGFGPSNPAWNGRGLSLGIRRTLRRYQDTSGKTSVPNSQEDDKKAWITSAEDYWAVGSSRRNSATDLEFRALRVARAYPFADGFELQLGGMVANPKQGKQGNEIAGFGPLLRWNLSLNRRWRLFADGGADLMQTGSPAYFIPTGGVGYNFFLRGGTGTTFLLHSAYWLDASFHWARITSGFGPGGNNYLPWRGQGLSLSLRHTFH